MKKFIIDTSVGIKWFFKEDYQQEALWFLEKAKSNEVKLIIPRLFYAEFMSACLKKIRHKLNEWHEAYEASENIMQLPLDAYSDKELVDVAFENAYRLKISIYDAFYISLAEIYLAPLVTADKALYDACRKRFDFIEYLGNFR